MFRLYMTQGQKQNHPNENRIKFYQEVVQTAECCRLTWTSILIAFEYTDIDHVNVQTSGKASTSLMPEQTHQPGYGTPPPAQVPDSQP